MWMAAAEQGAVPDRCLILLTLEIHMLYAAASSYSIASLRTNPPKSSQYPLQRHRTPLAMHPSNISKPIPTPPHHPIHSSQPSPNNPLHHIPKHR
jgi:hypothetical protein